MDTNFQDKVVALKYALRNDISNKYGIPIEVQLRQVNTKRLDTLIFADIIDVQNQEIVQRFEIFKDHLGDVYWDIYQGFNEQSYEKPVN